MDNKSIGENFVGSLPILVPLYWAYSTGLLGTDAGPWLLAVIAMLGIECGFMMMEWMKPQPVPHDDPTVWFDRLANAARRAGTVLYLAVALFWVDSAYFSHLKTALAHLDVSRSAVWAPCLVWAILLANCAYALSMGLRHGRSPRVPGLILGAALWIAGAAALILFHAFVPSPNATLGPNATAATNFFILWIYLNVILYCATRLAVALRGVGGVARERAREQEQAEKERGAWPTGD
jgi:hypothetical protein